MQVYLELKLTKPDGSPPDAMVKPPDNVSRQNTVGPGKLQFKFSIVYCGFEHDLFSELCWTLLLQ